MSNATPRVPRHRQPVATIVAYVRGLIVSGQYRPGDRLPTRHELERHFGASSVTIQKALDRLSAAGFVQARGPAGTFVALQPPHLCRVGLVLPPSLGIRGGPSRFWQALSRQAEHLIPSDHLQLCRYDGVQANPPSPGYQQLLSDLEQELLAGLIFVHLPLMNLEGAPPLTLPGLARACAGLPRANLPGVLLEPYVDKVLQRIRAEGRRSAAAIYCAVEHEPWPDWSARRWLERGAALGVEVRPQWLFPIHPSVPNGALSAARLLLASDPKNRPQALIIQDDNLVDAVTGGLETAVVAGLNDVALFVHANFPCPLPSRLPLRRVGYDMAQLLELSLDLIRQQRAGKTPPASVPLAAVFDDEFDDLRARGRL